MTLITPEELSRIARMDNAGGALLARFLMRVLKFDKVNNLYTKSAQTDPLSFINAVLQELECNFIIDPADLKRIPQKGPFIVVANHPYGGLDALILIKFMLAARPEFKVMGNFLLERIEPLKDLLLAVNPFETHKEARSSVTGIKHALQDLQKGHPIGIFPAGEVSSHQEDRRIIQDREWQPAVIKFIKKAEVPIVPVYFHGTNSRLFHFLGKIHPLLRTAKLPSELFNKKNKTIHVRIGMPIGVKEQKGFLDTAQYGRYLRARTYALGTGIEARKFFRPMRSIRVKKQQPIEQEGDRQALIKEVNYIKKEYHLFTTKNYTIFCAPSIQMPLLINELGRLREITFRAVGEGTNRPLDIDEYDLYYHQLVMWDEEAQQVVGAYRIGKGKDILALYNMKGFYLTSLFKISKQFAPIMEESIELGRSFITQAYQRKPMPLFLLWKGILFFLLKHPEYRYLIGPVSISNDFSQYSKSLIVQYIKRYHYREEFARFIRSKKRFKVHTDKLVESQLFLEQAEQNLSTLDKVIQDIERTYKFPILLKKYLQLNAKIIGFNVDPKFNNALDGLIILDIMDVPEDFIKTLSKELNDASILERFQFPEDNNNIES